MYDCLISQPLAFRCNFDGNAVVNLDSEGGCLAVRDAGVLYLRDRCVIVKAETSVEQLPQEKQFLSCLGSP